MNLHPFATRIALLLLLGTTALQAQSKKADLGAYADKFKGEWVKGKHGKLSYQIYSPRRVSSRKPLPVVVTLHGSAQVGTDNRQQIGQWGARMFVGESAMKDYPCIVIAPQCWTGTSWMADGGDAVIELVEHFLGEVKVADPKRVYVTGFSLGGFGTWYLLGKRPDLFAAGMPLAGGGDPSIAEKLKGENVAVWIYHGNDDRYVPVVRAQQMAKAMKDAGATVKYSELKAPHGIQRKVYVGMLKEWKPWLFKQKKK